LEFTAEQDCVEIPSEIAQLLNVDNYALITIQKTMLEKGTAIQLTPLSMTYLDVPDIRAALEAHIRKHYPVLVKNSVISLDFVSASNQTITCEFRVSDIKPEDQEAISCINTDIEVDIAPPNNLAINALEFRQSDNQAMELHWTPSVDNLFTKSVPGTINAKEYHYFKIKRVLEYKYYELILTPTLGDSDLFVDTLVELPSLQDHEYRNVDPGISRIELKGLENPFIFIAVRAFTDTKYELRALAFKSNPNPKPESMAPDTQSVTSVSMSTTTKTCEYCGKDIPDANYQTHSLFCQRNNIICQKCKKAVKRNEINDHWDCDACDFSGTKIHEAKHMFMNHTEFPCSCGQVFTVPQLSGHRKNDCPDRYIICRFCHLRVRAGQFSKTGKDLFLGNLHVYLS
jgi:hypothetical protein